MDSFFKNLLSWGQQIQLWNFFKRGQNLGVFLLFILIFFCAHTFSLCFQTIILKQIFSLNLFSLEKKEQNQIYSFSRKVLSKKALASPIYERNLFDSSQAPIPEFVSQTKKADPNLNNEEFLKLSCSDEKLPIDFVGILHSKGVKVVLLQDPEYPIADLYREGESLFDYPDYTVFRIYPRLVEFRYLSKKICYQLGSEGEESSNESLDLVQNQEACIQFSSQEIRKAIGEGYVNILNAGRLIPISDDLGNPGGFRIIGIDPNSIFQKIFENGDVLMKINETSLKDPSRGFALYQALNEEKEIAILLERKGQKILRKVCID